MSGPRGGRAVRPVAALVALVVGLTSMALGVGTGAPTPAGAQVAGAQVTVSKTTGVLDTGETVTITGTGFDPTAHVGTRPPLAGQPSGVYLIFGRFGDPWRPSAGAPASAREAITQKWVLPAAQRALLDPTGTNEDYVTLAADGTFTTELELIPGGTSGGGYAVATYAGSGAVDSTQETLTPVSFSAAPAWEPQVSVSTTSDLDPDGETVTVTGTGFDPAAHVGTRPPLAGQPSGVYVVFGRFADPWRPSDGAPSTNREALVQKWALPAAQRAQLDPTGTNEDLITLASDGTFTAELDVAPGGVTSGAYAIATYAGSGAVDAGQELLTPVTFAADVPPPTPGTGSGPTGQTLTVTPFSDLDPEGQELVVDGAGYDPALGIYVALCVDNGPNLPPSPCVGGSGETSGSSSSAWITDDVRYAELRTAPYGPGGTFSVTLDVTAADEYVDCYDPGTTCVLATRADHTATADRSADVKIPVFFRGQEPPVDPEPPATPDTTATIDRTSVVAGGDLTVSGEGFVPGEQVQVWLHSEPQLVGVVVADALGQVRTTFTVPATTPAGTHHVELYGITSALRLVSPTFTVVAAAVPIAAVVPPATTPAATTTGTLPATGSSPVLAITGAALLVLGAALTATSRSRSRRTTAAPSTPLATGHDTTWEPHR